MHGVARPRVREELAELRPLQRMEAATPFGPTPSRPPEAGDGAGLGTAAIGEIDHGPGGTSVVPRFSYLRRALC